MDKEFLSDKERLIAKFVRGDISPEDEFRLRKWIESSPENLALFERLGNRERMLREVDKMRRFDSDRAWKKIRLSSDRAIMKRASNIAMCTGAGVAAIIAVVLWLNTPSGDNSGYVSGTEPVIENVDASAVKLRRASGEVFAVDSIRRIDLPGIVAQSEQDKMVVRSVADRPALAVSYSTLEVPSGKQFRVTLEDGTRITVNAGSTLRFPERFLPGMSREVYLVGEAYFSVSKDVRRPFVVHTRESYVKVTGTEFNVNCYDDMSSQLTTLVSGSVNLGRTGSALETELRPGMQASQNMTDGSVHAYKVDVDDYTAWTKGLFSFRNKPLVEIMKSISRWYGCAVVFENRHKANLLYTGKISQNYTLEQTMELFQHTADINVTLAQDKVIIH